MNAIKILFKTLFCKTTVCLFIGTVIAMALWFAVPPVRDALKENHLTALNPKAQQRLTDFKGHLYIVWPEYGAPSNTAPNELPKCLVQAVMAREDKRFLAHSGVDFRAFGRAVLANLKAGGRFKQGGSTITMQLVDMTYQYPEDGIVSKLRSKVFEAIMAFRIERAAEAQARSKTGAKKLILCRYLDRIPYGRNHVGIQQAASFHFGKEVKNLDIDQCAYLAGLIRAPSKNSVYHSKTNAVAAHDAVLANMRLLDMIKLRQPKLVSWLRGVLPPIPAKRRGDGFTSDAVRAEVGRLEKQQLVPADLLTKPDLEIQLTSDLSLQDFARNALERQLSRIEKSSGFKAPGGQQVNGCVVILDNADSAILACVGGRSFDSLQLNLATSSPGRPLASAIKPFDYAALLEAEPGLAITSTISNSVLTDKALVGYRGNFAPSEVLPSGTYPFWIGLRDSSNRMALAVSVRAGRYHWQRLMRELSITGTTTAPDTSLFLGNGTVRPMDVAAAYACLARGGQYSAPFLIRRIKVDGKETHAHQPGSRTIMNRRTCTEITRALREVLRAGTASGHGGHELAARLAVAGKTGTSKSGADVWFCGFSSNVTVVVWIGFPEASIPILPDASGGSTAFPVWKEVIEELARRKYAFKELPSLPVPSAASGRKIARNR